MVDSNNSSFSILTLYKNHQSSYKPNQSRSLKMGCLGNLPEDCVSRIIALTSPQDACRVLAVSKLLWNPARSNLVWDAFLPADCCAILSSMPAPNLTFSSKKELFFLLSDSVFIDAGNKAFALEKSTGRKSFILSARELSILLADVGTNWTWKSIQESRFAQVAVLITTDRLEIKGTIRAQTLSQNTNYGAYLLFKISNGAYGLDSIPCEVSVESGNAVLSTSTASLRDPDDKKVQLQRLLYGNRVQKMKEMVNQGDERAARRRHDGWLEIEVGAFFVGGSQDNREIAVSVKEVKGYQLKGGLVVQGIEVRPCCEELQLLDQKIVMILLELSCAK